MFEKACIIYDNKICDRCGDCDFCDINPDKICDNCGRCIGDEYDYSGIQIDDLISSQDNASIQSLDFESDEWKFQKEEDIDQEDDILFIDDIKGLREEIESGNEPHEHRDCDCGHDHNPHYH